MGAGLLTRIAKLEAAVPVVDQSPQVRFVAWEDRVEDLDQQPPGITLPVKFATAEAWAAAMRQRFGYLMEHGPESHGL